MCVRNLTRCLLCNQSTTVLIGTGNVKSEELSELFEVFCDYLKLDPDRNLRNVFPGRLFPFCTNCSCIVYQLFDYHKEKVRILEKLSQVVVSMAVLILESDESHREPESFHNVGADPAAETLLAGQITALRKCVVQNYSPKLRLKAITPPTIILARKAECFDSTKNVKNPLKQRVNKVSADISSENILESSLQRRTKRSEAKLFMKIEQENNISDSDAEVGFGEAQDDSMDIDYGNDGDADDLIAVKSEEPDDSRNESSGDEGILRRRAKFRVTATGKKVRPPTLEVQIDESTYSLENYNFKVNGSEFKCETCPYTTSLVSLMRSHLRFLHISNVPPIPEKPMDDYKVGKNEYILAGKFKFEKVGEKEFRCSDCTQTATSWSKMYTHIRVLHFGPTRRRGLGLRGEPIPFTRAKVSIIPLGDNEMEYLSFKFTVLPRGSYKCVTCGLLAFTLSHMRGHIRKAHADFLPEVPDKSLEDFEIHPNLFCLSRRYLFEKTGENSFDCTFSDCNTLTPTWEEMYIHIWTDHYFALERSRKKQKRARRVESGKSSAASLAPDPRHIAPTEDKEEAAESTNNASEPLRNETRDESLPEVDGSIPEAHGSIPEVDGNISEVDGNISEVDGNIPKPEGEADQPAPTAETSAQSRRLLGERKRKRILSSNLDAPKVSQVLADLEISPGHYSYMNFEFHLSDDGLRFVCDTCDAPFDSKATNAILSHIREGHKKNRGFTKTGPNEYLYRGTYPAIRDEAGKFRCRVEDCVSLSGFLAQSNLRNHIIEIHVKGKGKRNKSVLSVEGRFEKSRKQEQFKRTLSKCQVGPNQYSYEGVGFNLRDGLYICSACGLGRRDTILTHITNKHVKRERSRVLKPRSRLEKLSFEEVSPDELLVGGEFRVYRQAGGKLQCGVPGCDSVVSSRGNLMMHIRMTHKPVTLTVCEQCGKAFKDPRFLKIHQASQHEQGEEQECPQCHKVLRNPVALRLHLASHRSRAAMKPIHQCHLCGKAYTCRGGLKIHLRTQHAEVRPTFPCDQCDRVYKNPLSLVTHKRVEHLEGGKKSHPCPVCQKQFKFKETVRRHIMVVHEGMKSSEVYKRNKKPRSSAGGTAAVRKRTKKKKPETDEDPTDSSVESTDSSDAGEDDAADSQDFVAC